MIGFGSIGQGVLPLIFRHIDIKPEPDHHHRRGDRGGLRRGRALRRRVHQEAPDPRPTIARCWTSRLGKGDFLVNLSVEVASTALVELCQEKGALYIDTCIEPWPGGYTDPNLSVSRRSNYALRDTMLKLKPQVPRRADGGDRPRRQPRPGFALREAGADQPRPRHRREGQGAGQPRGLGPSSPARLGVKVIHIAERDTQVSPRPEGGRRVRQYLVDRRLRLRRRPAGRDGLGHAREGAAARRRAPRRSAATPRST